MKFKVSLSPSKDSETGISSNYLKVRDTLSVSGMPQNLLEARAVVVWQAADRFQCSFQGYWVRGKTEHVEVVEGGIQEQALL